MECDEGGKLELDALDESFELGGWSEERVELDEWSKDC